MIEEQAAQPRYRPPGRAIRPFWSFSRRWRVGAFLAFAVLIAGLPFVFKKGASSFTSEAVFQVSARFQSNLRPDPESELQSNSQYRQFVNHLSETIRYYELLAKSVTTLQKKGIDVCRAEESLRKCVERLQRILVVRPIPDTYLVKLSLTAGSPTGLDAIVNTILDEFVTSVQTNQIYGADERLENLNRRIEEIDSEISALETQRDGLATKLGLTRFTEGAMSPFDEILAVARRDLVVAELELTRAESSINAFRKYGQLPNGEVNAVAEAAHANTTLTALRAQVVLRTEELTKSMVGLTEKHPAYQLAAAEREKLLNRLAQAEKQAESEALKQAGDRLNAAVARAKQIRSEQAIRVDEITAQATQYATWYRQAASLSGSINKLVDDRNDIKNRINAINMERGAIGWVTVVSRALPAVEPEGVGKTRVGLILLIVCGVIMVGVPIALDYLDPRVQTVGDAEKAMDIEAAAWFVSVEGVATETLAEEQSRRLASTLLRNRARGHSGLYAFTPISVGSEATNVILDMATMLQTLGSKVLIIDANPMRRKSPIPRSDAGLTAVLNDSVEATAAIESFAHRGQQLNVIPVGEEGMRLRRMDRFRSALAQWQAQFDMVLVDLPPIMHSADAELLIDAIGQVFLVVGTNQVKRTEINQAKNTLRRIDPEAVGLIVTNVPMEITGEQVHRQLVESAMRSPVNEVLKYGKWNIKRYIWGVKKR